MNTYLEQLERHNNKNVGNHKEALMEFGKSHMSFKYRRIDLYERLIVGEQDVVGGEHADEAGIHFVAATASGAHGSIECHILELLPVEILVPIVHAASLEEQLQQRNRLLSAVAGQKGEV